MGSEEQNKKNLKRAGSKRRCSNSVRKIRWSERRVLYGLDHFLFPRGVGCSDTPEGYDIIHGRPTGKQHMG